MEMKICKNEPTIDEQINEMRKGGFTDDYLAFFDKAEQISGDVGTDIVIQVSGMVFDQIVDAVKKVESANIPNCDKYMLSYTASLIGGVFISIPHTIACNKPFTMMPTKVKLTMIERLREILNDVEENIKTGSTPKPKIFVEKPE